MRTVALIVVFGLASCAAPRYVTPYSRSGFAFQGPRELRLEGSDGDVAGLESELVKHGFRVKRAIPGVDKPVPATRYVVSISGVCQARWLSPGPNERDLHADFFDTESSERVFVARLESDSGCPDNFFVELAALLDRRWPSGAVAAAPRDEPR